MKEKETNFNLKTITWLIVLLGGLAQLKLLLDEPSLWLDEATLAVNLIQKTFTDLMSPLDYELIVPIGYLWIQKTLVNLFGSSEWVFRLFSFFSGIILLVFTTNFLRKTYSQKIALIGTIITVTSFSILTFSVEGRHYIFEVLLASILFFTWIKNQRKLFIVFSVIGVCTTFTAFFILPLIILLEAFKKKTIKEWLPYIVWLVPAAFIYFLFYANHPFSGRLKTFHISEGGLLPLGLTGMAQAYEKLMHLFAEPLGLSMLGIGLVLLIIGIWISFKEQSKERIIPLLLCLAFVLSFMHIFPVGQRFTLYLFPFLLVGVLKGLEQLNEKSSLVFGVVAVVLLLNPVGKFFGRVMSPADKEDWRAACKELFLKRNTEDIYLSYNARAPFEYYQYKNFVSFDRIPVIEGHRFNDLDNFKRSLKSVKTEYFYVLIGHDYPVENGASTDSKIDWLKESFTLISKKTFDSDVVLLYLKK